MQFQSLQIDASSDLESILRTAVTRGANGLIIQTDFVSLYHRFELADLATRYRLPTIYAERLYSEAGGSCRTDRTTAKCIGSLRGTWTKS
jgi:hypothetical protein